MPDNTCITCGRVIPEGRHICLACEHENEVNPLTPKPRTNGDRIRQMTNAELVPVVLRYACHRVTESGRGCPFDACDDCVKRWLDAKI